MDWLCVDLDTSGEQQVLFAIRLRIPMKHFPMWLRLLSNGVI